VILNPDIDDATLDTIYDQLGDDMIQTSQLDFPVSELSQRTTLQTHGLLLEDP
jgi:hypothetical protein